MEEPSATSGRLLTLALGLAAAGASVGLVVAAAGVGLVAGLAAAITAVFDFGLAPGDAAEAVMVIGGAIVLPVVVARQVVEEPFRTARDYRESGAMLVAARHPSQAWSLPRQILLAGGLAAVTCVALELWRPLAAIAVALIVGWNLAVRGTGIGVALGFLAAVGLVWIVPGSSGTWLSWVVVVVASPIVAAAVVRVAHGIGFGMVGRTAVPDPDLDERAAALIAHVEQLPQPEDWRRVPPPPSDDAAVPLRRDWPGRTQPGGIIVSVEEALDGGSEVIYEHEAVHDRLLKTTPFGHIDFALSLLADVGPDGDVSAHATELRNLVRGASWSVQEGAATYAGARHAHRADAGGVIVDYEEAAAEFEWLDDRAGLTDFQRAEAAKILARRALQAPLLEAWFRDDLWQLDRLEAHLSEADNVPDRRLDLVMTGARGQDDAEIAAGVMAQLRGDPFALTWAPPSNVSLCPASAEPERLMDLYRRFAERACHPGLTVAERTFLSGLARHQPVPWLGPSATSLVVTPTSGGFEPEVPASRVCQVCSESDLLMIVGNPTPVALPSRYRISDEPRLLPSGQADIRAERPGRSDLCRVPLADLGDLLAEIPTAVSIGVYDPGYDFDAEDFFCTRCLRGRDHFVLVQSPWSEVAPRLGIGGLARTRFQLLLMGVDDEHSELGFFMLRPRRPHAPVIVVPSLRCVGDEMLWAMMRCSGLRLESAERLEDLVDDPTGLHRMVRSITGGHHEAVYLGEES